MKIDLDKKYHLAISLEVAEHISAKNAAKFVDSLTSAAGFILFSAAIPFQGGTGHVNEQWPDYWVSLFANRGFVTLDLIRDKIWNDGQIPSWYRQNILLFVKEEELHRVAAGEADVNRGKAPLSMVHPDTYLARVEQMSTLKGSWKIFRRAVKAWLKARVTGG